MVWDEKLSTLRKKILMLIHLRAAQIGHNWGFPVTQKVAKGQKSATKKEIAIVFDLGFIFKILVTSTFLASILRCMLVVGK